MLNRAKLVKYRGCVIEANRIEFFYEVDGKKISVLLMAKRFQFPKSDIVTKKIAYYLGYSYLIDIAHMTFPKKVEVLYIPPNQDFWKYMFINVVGEALIRWKAPSSILNDIEFYEIGKAPQYKPIEDSFNPTCCLVPIGGGKASIVTYEMAKKKYDEIFTMSVQAPGHNWDEIAPMIKKLNCIEMFDSYEDMKFLNSYQPITSGNAIFNYSMIALLVARELGTSDIIFGNDQSVNNEYLWEGILINHMFDKTKEFRSQFNNFVSNNIVKGYNFISLIEDMSGIEVAKELSKHIKYYKHLCSCNYADIKKYKHNKNGQCGNCLKCMYTYLCICYWGHKKYADTIFGNMSVKTDLMNQLLEDNFRDDCFGGKFECKKLIDKLKEEN